ncbi:MAG: hypothetical protein WCI50_02440 [Actinomycetes bacterium]
MSNGLAGRLRVTMAWVPSDDLAPLDGALEWADRLDLLQSSVPRVCIWTTRAFPPPTDHPAATHCCWHDLDLPRRIDRHVAADRPDLPWSPWGTKSGPNFQFFVLLDAVAAAHPEEWVLYTEPDTLPVELDVTEPVTRVLERHPDAWMIGAPPHVSELPALEPELHHHLNGAALYRVGARAFADFRAEVWIPSLLSKVRDRPEYAYDCLTDPAQWAELAPPLATAWRTEAQRFVATAGMVNASTSHLTPPDVDGVLTEPVLTSTLRREGTRPWLLHAKGRFAGATRTANPERYAHQWHDVIDHVADQGRAADRVIAFLHLPKTAGTSFRRAFAASDRWRCAELHPSYLAHDACDCGRWSPDECDRHRLRREITERHPESCRGRSLLVALGHESVDALDWLRSALADRGVTVEREYLTVRPATARITSMVTDFWTSPADDADADAEALRHRWARDAEQYLHRGRPDVRAWLETFAIHGAGQPFWLDEIFAGSSGSLRERVATGTLELVRTADVDRVVFDLAGVEAPRARVGAPSPDVVAELTRHASLVRDLAARDAAFDRVIADLTGDDAFRP